MVRLSSSFVKLPPNKCVENAESVLNASEILGETEPSFCRKLEFFLLLSSKKVASLVFMQTGQDSRWVHSYYENINILKISKGHLLHSESIKEIYLNVP